jgi:hypothetical protein
MEIAGPIDPTVQFCLSSINVNTCSGFTKVFRGHWKYSNMSPVAELTDPVREFKPALKVSTNEKRGGLKVVAFHRPPFKLLSRKFSKESVQAPSCERHKTTQRTPVSIICKQLLIPNNAIVSACDTLFTSYT